MDSAGTIVASIQAASRDLGLEEPSREAASHIIGLGLHEAVASLFPELDYSWHEKLADRYRHHYLGKDQEIALFDGAEACVLELLEKGAVLAVATGKSRRGLDRALGHSGLGPHFSATRCADECFSKPHPQMLLELMEETGIPAERTLMIGDTSHDLQMAVNAGVAGLGVGYGAHPRGNLLALSPLACLDSMAELRAWLVENA